jgi:hypothetical protein
VGALRIHLRTRTVTGLEGALVPVLKKFRRQTCHFKVVENVAPTRISDPAEPGRAEELELKLLCPFYARLHQTGNPNVAPISMGMESNTGWMALRPWRLVTVMARGRRSESESVTRRPGSQRPLSRHNCVDATHVAADL